MGAPEDELEPVEGRCQPGYQCARTSRPTDRRSRTQMLVQAFRSYRTPERFERAFTPPEGEFPHYTTLVREVRKRRQHRESDSIPFWKPPLGLGLALVAICTHILHKSSTLIICVKHGYPRLTKMMKYLYHISHKSWTYMICVKSTWSKCGVNTNKAVKNAQRGYLVDLRIFNGQMIRLF